MDYQTEALRLHAQWQGKMETCPKLVLDTKELLALAYTPGVAEPCLEIQAHPEQAYTYTGKANTIAIVTDGTAVLGLGNIGPGAALPVMEGKAMLFKQFGGVNAVPICLDTQDVDEIVETVVRLAPAFGGINLEDISAPRCFEIERRLKERLNIPVFHDDQHGTAICVLAALINAFRLTGKDRQAAKVVINGAGSAGVAIGKLLYTFGFKHITFCGRNGIISSRCPGLDSARRALLSFSNLEDTQGTLADALCGADVFIGVSVAGALTREMVQTMNTDAIVLAMANPVPEIYPEDAFAGGARIVGTGRSDYPNQINNLLAFPGIFKGALECHAPQITEEMKIASARAIAALVSDDELTESYLIPDVFDARLADAVADAVKSCWEAQAAGLQSEDGSIQTPASSPQEGLLITFEGGEGVGKSTHIAFLSYMLKKHGYEVLCLREPGGTTLGEDLRRTLLDPKNTHICSEAELLMYEAARAQLVDEVIVPALRRGAVVLCDRFTDSTLAYQAYGRGLNPGAVAAANRFAAAGIVPKRTIVLSAGPSVEDSLYRATKDHGADRIEQEGRAFHERVNSAFARLASTDSQRVRKVVSSGTKIQTAQDICTELADIFPWMQDCLEDEAFFEPLKLHREQRNAFYAQHLG